MVAGHTYAFRHLPLEDALDALVALGFDSVELWLGHSSGSPDRAVAALVERRLTTVAVSAGGFYSRGGASVEGALELVAAVRAAVLVACVAPNRLPSVAARVPEGVALCVENHWDQPLAVPRQLRRAVVRSAQPTGVCLDTGHALAAGVRPERFARAVGPRLGHVHLKEGVLPTVAERLAGRRIRRRLLPRPRPLAPGDGDLRLEPFADALRDVGYTGTITIEHEGPDPSAAIATLLRSWIEVSGRVASARTSGG